MAKAKAALVEGILEDYALAFEKMPQEWREQLKFWEAFFRERAHILRRGNDDWPAYKILLQLAMEHADDSPVTKGAERYLAAGKCDWPWLRRERRLNHVGIDPCLAVLEGHTGWINGALALPDGRILSWSNDKTLRLWDRGGKPLAVLDGHTSQVQGALLLPEGWIISWSEDKTFRLWDEDGQPLEVYGLDEVLQLYPEVRRAFYGPNCVCGNTFLAAMHNSAILAGDHGPTTLWHVASGCAARLF
jgi:WD40 repeat protein